MTTRTQLYFWRGAVELFPFLDRRFRGRFEIKSEYKRKTKNNLCQLNRSCVQAHTFHKNFCVCQEKMMNDLPARAIEEMRIGRCDISISQTRTSTNAINHTYGYTIKKCAPQHTHTHTHTRTHTSHAVKLGFFCESPVL